MVDLILKSFWLVKNFVWTEKFYFNIRIKLILTYFLIFVPF